LFLGRIAQASLPRSRRKRTAKFPLSPSKASDLARRRRAVTVASAPSHEVTCVSECCERPRSRAIGFPAPAVTSPVSRTVCAVCRSRRPPQLLHRGFILSYASVPLQSARERCPPVASRRRAPSLGFIPPSRHQPAESTHDIAAVPRASQARSVPSSTFLTPSTVFSSTGLVGLFHPTATSGVRSSRVFPPAEPYGLVARLCPRVVTPASCPQFYPWAPVTDARLQGVAPRESP
jgi:hypothetical protein